MRYALALSLFVFSLGVGYSSAAEGDAAEAQCHQAYSSLHEAFQQQQSWSEKAKPLSVHVFQGLKKIEQLIEAKRYAQSERELLELQRSAKKPQDSAFIQRTLGYLLSEQERYAEAGRAFERSLKSGGLPREMADSLVYNLGQIYLAQDDFKQVTEVLEPWLKRAKSPPPHAFMTLGYSYAQLGKHREAIPHVKRTLSLVSPPPENCLKLLLALHYELNEPGKCIAVLKELVRYYPEKKDYWLQLSSLEHSRGKIKEALAAFLAAKEQGLLTKESEWIQLARLQLAGDVPFEAATTLSQVMDEGKVRRTVKNLKLLSQSWRMAKELEKATEALELAARESSIPEDNVLLAELYSERAMWKEAARTLEGAFKKGGMKEPGRAYLLLGYAYYELNDKDAAKKALEQALEFRDSEKAAKEWLKLVS